MRIKIYARAKYKLTYYRFGKLRPYTVKLTLRQIEVLKFIVFNEPVRYVDVLRSVNELLPISHTCFRNALKVLQSKGLIQKTGTEWHYNWELESTTRTNPIIISPEISDIIFPDKYLVTHCMGRLPRPDGSGYKFCRSPRTRYRCSRCGAILCQKCFLTLERHELFCRQEEIVLDVPSFVDLPALPERRCPG